MHRKPDGRAFTGVYTHVHTHGPCPVTEGLRGGSRQAGGSDAVPQLTDPLLQTQYLGYLRDQQEEKKSSVVKNPELITVPRGPTI